MLKLYYTTTKGEGQIQPNYYSSLGGYRSSTLVKNDEFDNFFGEISSYTVSNNNQNQYLGLILKNESSVAKNNVKLWFERSEDCYSKLYIAAVELTPDQNGFNLMEDVASLHSCPIYAEFYECESEATAVDLGDLAANEAVGIWLKREILSDKAKEDILNLTTQDPNDEFRVVQNTLNTSDTIEIKMSYTNPT